MPALYAGLNMFLPFARGKLVHFMATAVFKFNYRKIRQQDS
jgi:hypothetical protein